MDPTASFQHLSRICTNLRDGLENLILEQALHRCAV